MNLAEQIDAVQEAWQRLFPDEPPQGEVFIRSWIRHAGDFDNLISWLEYTAECHAARPLKNPGAWITSRLKPQNQVSA